MPEIPKDRAFEEGVLWRQRGSPKRIFLNATAFTSNEVVYYRPHMRFATRADKKELWGFPAPLSELFPVTLRSTDSLREPACWWEKGGKKFELTICKNKRLDGKRKNLAIFGGGETHLKRRRFSPPPVHHPNPWLA